MAAFSDSDEDETFVTLGTEVDVPEQDEPRRKPVSMQDMAVKDSKGRARFHGAFTGGYSAGYFNTVGSQKGFTPSTFVSSREKKADSRDHQRPEDFMDDEDLGEYGIAPRKLVTAGTFSSEERKKRRRDELTAASSDAIIPGEAALLDLIVPERITIGVKLLRKMGWKEGQGLGPRLNRKQKKREKAGMKVYGCMLPPSPDSEDDIDDETFLSDLTYAPKDTTAIYLSVKDNTHGLGYRGLNPRSALPSAHLNLFEPPAIKKSGRKGIKGQAFGVGAMEDDDDDIYAVDDMSNYDMTMGGEEQDANFGWTGPRKRGPVQTPVGYVGKILEGFSLSSSKLVQTKLFPPPELPRGYRPVHVFARPEQSAPAQVGTDYRQFLRPDTDRAPVTATQSTSSSGRHKPYSDATARSMALGEQAFVGSVFDLIPKEDRVRMESSRKGTHQSSSEGGSQQQASEVESQHCTSEGGSQDRTETRPQSSDAPGRQQDTRRPGTADEARAKPPDKPAVVEDQRQQNAPLYQGGLGFKPFLKDPRKQERYDRYLAMVKQGHKAPYSAVMEDGQTEWEAEREREEFSRAANLYRPLANMMAMRFTTASQLGDTASGAGSQPDKVEKSEAAKAAEMRMYGQLTREVLEWHPDKLVCKRFNVPNPYPGSNIIGLASVKRDKYSVFNFLDFANQPATSTQPTGDFPALTSGDSTAPPTDNSVAQSREQSSGDGRDAESESKADKELNKFKKMKNIFSHLTEPGAATKKKSGVSFSMKTAKPKQQKEFKSIFSHLDGEDDKKKRRLAPMKTETSVQNTDAEIKTETRDSEAQNKADQKEGGKSEEPKSGMDLFRTIFRNTDSEESSSSDSEEDAEAENEANNTADIKQEPTPLRPDTNTHSADTLQINNVQERAVLPSDVATTSTLPGSGARIETIEERLSPKRKSEGESDDSDSYGPALPPALSQESTVEFVSQTPPVHIDLTQAPSKKHKHKDKHKAKKAKKEKHKKSKHKKKHKKKESKKRKRRHTSDDDDDSSDTSDKESDSDPDTMPTDRELLNRMKMLKPGQSAAEFL